VEHANLFFSGLGLGSCLIAIGGAIGYRLGKRRAIRHNQVIDQGGILQLLQQLGRWTSEYSGHVSRYQDRLGELSRGVAETATNGASQDDVPGLLTEIMQSNRELKQRLDVAENQLEKQTRQLESYLSEARTDALTGLANRRALDQKLEESFAAFQKGTRPAFVLILVDIDHFKQINDELGHPAGDEVLRQVATSMAEELKTAEIVARFGGEEFAAILPAPLRVAADRANQMRRIISRRQVSAGDASVSVTISIGLCEVQDDGSLPSLIRCADQALYQAKGMGRNRVYYHDGMQPVLQGAPEVAKDAKQAPV